ncbi:EF-hand calcium-binding domain-containing protein 1-like [Liolophura sinensis]|uniref:EF-hand calcium-binding domain-containing protein 1-like n=1 Tax=Liolophura sinensis TaxID=3198878 RepID=UPI0031581B17
MLVNTNATCDFGCRMDCTQGFPCKLKCDMVCGRRRRSLDLGAGSFHFQRDFSVYDVNNNNFISLEELAELVHSQPSNEGVRKALFVADTNGDMLISREEFQKAPWDFE